MTHGVHRYETGSFLGAPTENSRVVLCRICARPAVDPLHDVPATPPESLLEILTRRGVVTTDPADRDQCCGLPRDEDGFCTYRESHPIYLEAEPTA